MLNYAGHLYDEQTGTGWLEADVDAAPELYCDGIPLYRLEDGKLAERSAAEIAADAQARQAEMDATAAAQADAQAKQQAVVAMAMLQAQALPDAQAAQVAVLFELWAPDAYAAGDRRKWGSLLYKARQAHTTADPAHTPDLTPALWAVVDDGTRGRTPDTAVPYVAHMEATEGLYYSHGGKVYVCIEGYDGATGHVPDVLPRYFEEVIL